MKKIFLLFSVLFAMVACSSDDTTTKESENNNNGTPDPSFLWPTVETNLFFLFTNSEGENILDPSSPAYVGNNHLPQCKIFWETDYISSDSSMFRVWETSNPTSSSTNVGEMHYYLQYNMYYHFAKRIPNYTFDGYENFQDLILDRMWMKAQILFDDGTVYNVYATLEKYNDGTYAMGANKVYVNDELVFQGDPDNSYELEIPIVKD